MNTFTRRGRVWAAFAPLAALLTATLTACTTDGGEAPTAEDCAAMQDYAVPAGAQSVVAVLDATGSARDGGWTGAAFDELVTQAAGVYSTLSVLWVGGAGEAPVWAIDAQALNDEGYEFDTLKYNTAVANASACVELLLGAPSTTEPGTDLGTAIQVAADRLAEASGPRRLVVVSDGLSNTGPIDLTGAIGTTPVASVAERLTGAGFQPDLRDASVTFAGLGVTADTLTAAPSVTWLRNLYTAICRTAGAAECEAPVADQGATADGTQSRADAPEDADLELPLVQFAFDESEVRFALDSTEITADADAALGKVAACLADGGTLTVVGHADNTGDPSRNRELASGRAQRVADRILALAGNPAVTVVAFGVGSDEPLTETGDQPEDRRVEISLAGACS